MTGKENENGTFGFQYRKPVHRTKWESFQKAIYDSSNGEVLGRTPKNWGQLLLFYTIFYIILAALFAICMQGLFATLYDKEPKWQLDSSLIGTNPGLGFRPIAARTEEGSLIWYNKSDEASVEKWTTLIDEFLDPYMKDQAGSNIVSCDFDKEVSSGSVCLTDMASFGNCNKNNSYGYRSGSPCVFLKLNRIFGWEPEYYTEPQEGMPNELNYTLNALRESNNKQIWVTCQGENPSDNENLNSFNYSPRGFPSYFYPYKNTDNYLSPLVSVQIVNPKPNVLINIECRAWAKNIKYEGGNLKRTGSVHFEIMVD